MMNRKLLNLRRLTKAPLKSQRLSFRELLLALHQPEAQMQCPTFCTEGGGIKILFGIDGKRMRKVVKRSNYRMTGKYPSLKNGRMMQWESEHEKAAFEILESCPSVDSYYEQPAEIQYLDESGKKRRHYPDILVQMKSGTRVFLEIKAESDAQNPELLRRTTLLSKQLLAKGYYYHLVTSDQIESEAYLANARQLVCQSRRIKAAPPWNSIRRAFQGCASLTFNTLIERINHSSARSWVCKLVLAGDLAFDQSQPLNDETLIKWIEGV